MNGVKAAIFVVGLVLSIAPSTAAENLNYKIMEVTDTSYAGNRRVVYRVYINTQEIPTQATMEAVAKHVWNANKRGWNEFTVFMIFGPITDFSAGAYGTAKFDKRGMTDFQISSVPLQILEKGEKFPEKVETKPQPKPWELEDNSTEASIMARNLVKERLITPSTAKFPGMFEMRRHVQKTGPAKYRIRSWVDAQNRFGAMVRINFVAEIQQTGPELDRSGWKLTSFTEIK
jgi:hypothetical protein